MPSEKRQRPFLKWAGSKYQIIDSLTNKLNDNTRLIEPFVGSAAVFLNSDYDEYLLNDNNPDLINLFNIIKEQGQNFITLARKYFTSSFNNEKKYYQLRDEFNRSDDPLRRSLLFLYLNRHGYNGLCRYNASGGFNVPFGSYKRPYFPEEEILAFHKKAQKATFTCSSFADCMQQATTQDTVYCDPPYVPLSASAKFTSYCQTGFTQAHQEELKNLAKKLADKGIDVLLSNHDTEFTRQLYQDAELSFIKVKRYISCNVKQRDTVSEILALYTSYQ